MIIIIVCCITKTTNIVFVRRVFERRGCADDFATKALEYYRNGFNATG